MTEPGKTVTRRALLEARRGLSDSERDNVQTALDQHLLDPTRPWFSPRCSIVAGYAGLPDEASVDGLLERLAAKGVSVAYPRVEGDQLSFCLCQPEVLVPATFGIPEPPQDRPPLALHRIDLFLVPGVGFTESGHRIGYGRGFYDRALASADARSLRIGVGFEVQICPSLPLEPHDEPLDGLVTERGFRWRSG